MNKDYYVDYLNLTPVNLPTSKYLCLAPILQRFQTFRSKDIHDVDFFFIPYCVYFISLNYNDY